MNFELIAVSEERFQIDNDQKAEWALKKIAEADAELRRMTDWYDEQKKKAQQQHDENVQGLMAMLREYFENVPAKDTKTTRKYALPGGELVLNKAKKDFAVENPEALLGWCKVNDPALVKVRMEPAWADVKKRLSFTDAGIVDSTTGLVVDGVVELDKPEEFKVRMKGEQSNG